MSSNLTIDQIRLKGKFAEYRLKQIKHVDPEVKQKAISLIDDFLDEMDLETKNG